MSATATVVLTMVLIRFVLSAFIRCPSRRRFPGVCAAFDHPGAWRSSCPPGWLPSCLSLISVVRQFPRNGYSAHNLTIRGISHISLIRARKRTIPYIAIILAEYPCLDASVGEGCSPAIYGMKRYSISNISASRCGSHREALACGIWDEPLFY